MVFVSGRAATSGARLNLEARGLGGGVRGQGGAQGAKGASKTLSAADAGHRRHIIALGLIALSADTVLCRVGVGGVRENVISVVEGCAWCHGALDSAAVRCSRIERCQSADY